jgi:hypothetical protein
MVNWICRSKICGRCLVIAGIAPLYITAIAQSELIYKKKGAEGTPRIFQQEIEKKTHFLSIGHPREYPY